MAEEIKAKKVPYVCLSTDVERDEYNKLSLTEWNVDSTDILYIVECSDGGRVQHLSLIHI